MGSKTILIVEDHADTRLALQLVLKLQGYQVLTAASAAEGEQLALANHVDLLISDIGLPDEFGWGMIARVRAKKPLAAIALSGFGTEADKEKSRSAGFNEHLTKPYEVSALKQVIKRLLHPEISNA